MARISKYKNKIKLQIVKALHKSSYAAVGNSIIAFLRFIYTAKTNMTSHLGSKKKIKWKEKCFGAEIEEK